MQIHEHAHSYINYTCGLSGCMYMYVHICEERRERGRKREGEGEGGGERLREYCTGLA